MRGHTTVNFLAKTQFACSAKVPSAVGDRCGGIPAAGPAVAPARHVHASKWVLAHLYFSIRESNVIQRRIVFDSCEPLSIHLQEHAQGHNSWESHRLRQRTRIIQIGACLA